jgi:hypothetical protein
MTSIAPKKQPKKTLIRDASGDPTRPRRKMPNTRRANVWYAIKVLIALPLVPLWPVFLAIEAREPYYVNHYFETIYNGLRTLWHAYKNGSVTRFVKYNIFTTPAYIEEQLGARLGACTRCAKCCKMLQCDYLAYNKKDREYYCSVYNTPYWIFGSCGRYPIDQQDIDDYNCPGFGFPESVAAAAGAGAPQPILLTIGKLPRR